MAEFPHPLYRNYVTNPSLEADATNWTTYGWTGTGERVKGSAKAGDWFFRLTASAEVTGNAGRYFDTPAPVKAGEAWTASIHVRPSRTITMRSMGELRVGGGVVGPLRQLGPEVLCVAGEWTRLHVTMTAIADATWVRHQVYLQGARLKAGDTLDLDAECVSKGELTHYFDGSGVYPVESLKRRNINPDPKVSSLDFYRKTSNDVATVVSDEGSPAIELLEGADPNTTLYIDPVANWRDTHGLSAGQWLAHSAEVKAINGYTNTTSSIVRIMSYNNGSINTGANPSDYELSEESYKRMPVARQIAAIDADAYFRTLVWPSAAPGEGSGFRVRRWIVAVGNTQAEALEMVATYFDGDSAPSGNLSYRWAADGTSLEVETIQPPSGRTTAWDGEPYKSTSTLWVGPASGVTGVFEVGASTEARLGIVSDIYSRSREKIQLKLAGVDDLVRSGHRIELAAAAMTSTPAVWHWRQVTGPTVALNVRENTCDFIAPDVERSTRIRIGVYAASEDGANRSDWRYFDLDVEPPMLRFRGEDDGDFSPRSPYLVGYSRGKREIWNDVIRPATYEKNPRHELEVVDLGVPDDDVVFSTETPRRMAAGGVWVNPETGDVFRNFGAGYNETDDTTASPRTSTYWVNPANGDILEWIED